MGFLLYNLYVVSYFMRLPNRLPVLGAVRFDLLLILVLLVISLARAGKPGRMERTSKALLLLCAVIVVSVPFAQWPGTVLKTGLERLLRAVLFYYFTVSFVGTGRQLKQLVGVFLTCQTLRILEPLYLHYTAGYWGGKMTMALDRLAGGPYDVINPNGLGYLVAAVIPFYYFLGTAARRWQGAPLFALMFPAVSALMLTGSRSGLLATLVGVAGTVQRSRRKVLLAALVAAAAVFAFKGLSDIQRDRYHSILDHDNARFGRSAQGRIDSIWSALGVAMERPVFGFGLGTSLEANYHKLNRASPVHNLFAEVIQEIGLVGFAAYMLFLIGVFRDHADLRRLVRAGPAGDKLLLGVADALVVWMWVNLVSSLASYGLSTWEWYLNAGLAVSLRRLLTGTGAPEKEAA